MTQRAAIHAEPMKSFSAAQAAENERRWTKDKFDMEIDCHGQEAHYDWSRRNLNFEIVDGKIKPMLSQEIPLHERLAIRLKELGFKQLNTTPEKQANCCLDFFLGGNTDRMRELAFGHQAVDYDNPRDEKNGGIERKKDIEDWAMKSYLFLCHKYGFENVLGFQVHLDETNPHAHALVVPVAEVKRNGRLRAGEERGTKMAVSFAGVFGKTRQEMSDYMSRFHTEYYENVGIHFGLERGVPESELTDEEKKARRHKTKKQLEEERLVKEEIEQQKVQLNKLSQKVEGTTKELDLARRRLGGLTTMVANLEEKRDAIIEDIEMLEKRAQRGEVTNEELQRQKEELLKELNDIGSSLDDKMKKLAVAERQLLVAKKKYNEQLQAKREAIEKEDKAGTITRLKRHVAQRDQVLEHTWPGVGQAKKSIVERTIDPGKRSFEHHQAASVENALRTYPGQGDRVTAASDLMTLAQRDFDLDRTWPAWIESTADEVLQLAKGIHPLSPFFAQGVSVGAGGGNDPGTGWRGRDDDDWRQGGIMGMPGKKRR